jgi:hypothetical protein
MVDALIHGLALRIEGGIFCGSLQRGDDVLKSHRPAPMA